MLVYSQVACNNAILTDLNLVTDNKTIINSDFRTKHVSKHFYIFLLILSCRELLNCWLDAHSMGVEAIKLFWTVKPHRVKEVSTCFDFAVQRLLN